MRVGYEVVTAVPTKLSSSGIQRRVVHILTDVSKEVSPTISGPYISRAINERGNRLLVSWSTDC